MEPRELSRSSARGDRSLRRPVISFAVVSALGIVLLMLGGYLDRTSVAVSQPHSVEAVGTGATGLSDPTPKVAPLGFAVPVRVRISTIGVDTALIQLGRNPDGTVQVPSKPQDAGWYSGGPSPGQSGSAVLLGHVDSYLGPAVFFDLRKMKPGDIVEVTRKDGSVARFTVTGVQMYDKDHFPAREVYGPHDGSTLQLVTCGGVFDYRVRSYESNLVVYTRLTGSG